MNHKLNILSLNYILFCNIYLWHPFIGVMEIKALCIAEIDYAEFAPVSK